MIKEIKYQQKYVRRLVDETIDLLRLSGSRQTLIFKAPTGSGKTVMAAQMLAGLTEELTNFGRLKLRPQLARYFDNGRKHMLIVYREELIDELVEEIRSLPPAPAQERGKLKGYVFSPGRYPFTDNFREVEDKVELVALPAAIYDAYQKVLPKRREKLFAEEEKRKETTIPTRHD